MATFVVEYTAQVKGSVVIDAESADLAIKWVQDESEIEELTSNSNEDTFEVVVSVVKLEPVGDDDDDDEDEGA